MSFLQPFLLMALPLALLPIIIHLIHLHRRRTVPWAAMMFLKAAQQMNRGFSRLRRWLILAFRVLAVAAILLTAARPLAGGWLGLTGGAPDTVIVLLDRSASMEQQNLASGLSKREAGLQKLTDGIRDAYRGRSRLVLIDSAGTEAIEIEKPAALADLPATWATDTASDIPALLQAALDHITANQTGRTDIWLLSDLQQTDWDASGGRWEPLRQAFTELQGVRFHLLCYPQTAPGNLAISAGNVIRREGKENAEILLDLEVTRTDLGDTSAPVAPSAELPLRFVVNGVASVHQAELRNGRLSLQGHALPVGVETKHGWGRIELPADASPADNTWHFVFDEPPVLKSVIVSDDPLAMAPLKAALGAPADPGRQYATEILPSARAAEITWEETALIIWQSPIPAPDDLVTKQLVDHVTAGRSLIFLPPEMEGDGTFMNIGWGDWESAPDGSTSLIDWWRNDAGLLANTRDGAALPVGEVGISRRRSIQADPGKTFPLARMEDKSPLMVRAAPDTMESSSQGEVFFLGALPGTGESTLARDGVVLFAMLHRALNSGAGSLGLAQQRYAAPGALPGTDPWKLIQEENGNEEDALPSELLPLRSGVFQLGEKMVALNRPPSEDFPDRLGTPAVEELFAGLDHRIIEDLVEDESSLASEIWRTFLILMALALLLEALLSMPAKRKKAVAEEKPFSNSREDSRPNTPAKSAA